MNRFWREQNSAGFLLGFRACNQGGFWNGDVLELCSVLRNARVKGFFEMLFIAWNPAAVKALIPARHDTALPLHTSCFGPGDAPICSTLPGCLVLIFVINSALFYKVLLIGPQLVEAGDQISLCFRYPPGRWLHREDSLSFVTLKRWAL